MPGHLGKIQKTKTVYNIKWNFFVKEERTNMF